MQIKLNQNFRVNVFTTLLENACLKQYFHNLTEAKNKRCVMRNPFFLLQSFLDELNE